jgi:rRNA-processing protein FCF1
VLLDTNALFLPVRVGFPLEEEVLRWVPGARLEVPASVLRELGRLVARRTRGAGAARTLAERYEVVPTRREGDDGVVDAAVRERAWVVTADRALRARLNALGVAVLVPQDRHRLTARPPTSPPSPRTVEAPTRHRARGNR